MFDYDVVIVGGGPAGLTAGLYLSQAKYRALLIDESGFGGWIKNVDLIENYPGFAEGLSGAHLASEMISQAKKYGLQFEVASVKNIELFSSTRWIDCGSKGYSASMIILAGGCKNKQLGVPGEEELMGKGIFNCAFCDGGKFNDQLVAVCGGGNAGVTEALYMAKIASKVILVEVLPELSANAMLQERVKENPKIEVMYGIRVEEMVGNEKVEALKVLEVNSGNKITMAVNGVLVKIGIEPNTDFLEGIVALDNEKQIIVNDRMETDNPYILAAGDIVSGSYRQVATAVGNGATAAITAQKRLQETC